jgi:hypothetical protein
MAVHIPDNLERYIVAVDGFIPGKDSMKMLLGETNANDEIYLDHFESRMSKKYHTQLDETASSDNASLYLMNPQNEAGLLAKYNPIQVEKRAIVENRENYRIMLMLSGRTESEEMKAAYFETLSELEFKVREENTFQDLPRFREYMRDISENIVERYIAPFLQVEKDLKKLGIDSNNTLVM